MSNTRFAAFVAILGAAGFAAWWTAVGDDPRAWSGRSAPGLAMGIAGTLAMIVAALYSWRRRNIRTVSRLIAIDDEARVERARREKSAMADLQELSSRVLRDPKADPKELRKEARAIVKKHGVGRWIRARVVGAKGRPPRVVLERREWRGRLQSWYAAHLVLGTLAVWFLLLHAGFRMGSGPATLAFALLCVTVLTGFVGVYLYQTVPPRLTTIESSVERSSDELEDELKSVLSELDQLAESKSDTFRRVFGQEMSIPAIPLKPSLRWLFLPAEIERDEARPDRLRLIVKEIPPAEQEDFRKAMRLMFRKEKLQVSLYPILRYEYLLRMWLVAHVPASAGAFLFSVVHVAAVMTY